MFTKRFATIAATVPVLLVVVFLSGPLAAKPADGAINRIEIWLDANTGLARAPTVPTIRFIEASKVPASKGTASAIGMRTRGLYDPKNSTIYLVRPWDSTDPQDVSVLLHELLHHRQYVHRVRCAGAQEYEAYKHQRAWLEEYGQNLNVSWIALSLGANCALRDVHPE